MIRLLEKSRKHEKRAEPGNQPARPDVNRLAAEDPEQQSTDQRDEDDHLPRLGPRTGEENQQDEQRHRVAENVREIGMQKRHGRNAHEPDYPPRQHAVVVDAGE